MMQINEKITETLTRGYMEVVSESYLMNTNMTEFRWFSNTLRPCALDKSSLSIGRVNCLFRGSQGKLQFEQKSRNLAQIYFE